MVSNLVSGMMQRIEKLRKYAFASVLILGEDNNAAIEGVWILRGQELAFNVRTGSCVWGGGGDALKMYVLGQEALLDPDVNEFMCDCLCSLWRTGTLMHHRTHSQSLTQTAMKTEQLSTSTFSGRETSRTKMESKDLLKMGKFLSE